MSVSVSVQHGSLDSEVPAAAAAAAGADSSVALQQLESPPPPRHTIDLKTDLSHLYNRLSWVRLTCCSPMRNDLIVSVQYGKSSCV